MKKVKKVTLGKIKTDGITIVQKATTALLDFEMMNIPSWPYNRIFGDNFGKK